MPLTTILLGLAIDVVVITGLVFAIYRPRHGKTDLALSYIVLNLGVFGAVALMEAAGSGLALGMGLFGILSIIRLRSSAISQTEVAYYFVALTLGLVNSLGAANLPLALSINVLLIGVLIALDRGAKALAVKPTERRRIVLNVIHADRTMLTTDLTRRMGGVLLDVSIEEIDYVTGTMVVIVEVEKPGVEPGVGSVSPPPSTLQTPPPALAPVSTTPRPSVPPQYISPQSSFFAPTTDSFAPPTTTPAPWKLSGPTQR